MSGLDQLALIGTATLELTHPGTGTRILIDAPTGEIDKETGKVKLVPITIQLVRSDSKEATEHTHQQTNRRLKAMGRKGKLKITADEIADDALSLLIFCTRGWCGIVLDNKELACNAGNARRLYSDERFSWLRSQVDEFIGDEANFLGNSPTS